MSLLRPIVQFLVKQVCDGFDQNDRQRLSFNLGQFSGSRSGARSKTSKTLTQLGSVFGEQVSSTKGVIGEVGAKFGPGRIREPSTVSPQGIEHAII